MNISIKSLLGVWADLIYDQHCGVCKSATKPGQVVCDHCDPRFRFSPHLSLLDYPYCKSCGEPLLEASIVVCEQCKLFPLQNRHVRSIWSYTEGIEEIICAYKYADARSLASFLAESIVSVIFAGAFPPEARYNWNLILPLPSTLESLAKRGFSPVGELSKNIGARLKCPISLTALKSIGKHPLQASLKPIERVTHIKKKFEADRSVVNRKQILLIDDVITSGASVAGSTLALFNAGALSVDVVTLARSEIFSLTRGEIYKRTRR